MNAPLHTSGRSLNFRDDINGLRALAVALVMLFHFRVPGVSGGFVGVDVFFVVSGYLMTSILVKQHRSGSVSFASFYLARARRIIPALAALCAVMLVFGWIWLDAPDYRALGGEAASALLFVSNLIFANEVGYFDRDAHEKWLLHTWSLSVEWQFYLVYPLLIYVIMRFMRGSLGPVLGALLVASLLYAIGAGRTDAGHAFYLLPPRAWEMLAGGLVFVSEKRVRAWVGSGAALEYAGFFLILLGALSQKFAAWPVPLIVPVAGAALVLLAGRQGSVLAANPVSRAIGQWSYSIYLWHWPLLVASLYFGLQPNLALSAGLILASIALGALSYRWVEEPFRHGNMRARANLAGMAALTAAVAIPAGLLVLTNGLPQRHPEALAKIEEQALGAEEPEQSWVIGAEKCGWNKKAGEPIPCRIGDPAAPASVAVWGDSHASKYRASLEDALRGARAGAELYFRNGCRPLQGLLTDKTGALKDCTLYNRKVLEEITSHPNIDTVLLIANWPYDFGAGKREDGTFKTYFGQAPLATKEERYREYADHVVQDLCALKRLKTRVAVTGPLPYFGQDIPRTMARTFIFTGRVEAPTLPRADHVARNKPILDALAKAHAECGVEVLDPLPYICDDTMCSGAIDGRPLFSDDNHLSVHGNTLLRPMLEAFLKTR